MTVLKRRYQFSISYLIGMPQKITSSVCRKVPTKLTIIRRNLLHRQIEFQKKKKRFLVNPKRIHSAIKRKILEPIFEK